MMRVPLLLFYDVGRDWKSSKRDGSKGDAQKEREMNGQNGKGENHYLTLAIPIGAGLGVALGLVLMNVVDHPGFFAVGIAIGLSLGTAIGLALDSR
jgi:hypothetical protein